ncbi:MAG: hypothetical protein SFW67_08195 [Myxococcaceae bacterium]|nr:hypothetical protein [Myxococcaceae bacterium]
MEATRPASSVPPEPEARPTAALDRLLNLSPSELEARAAQLLSALDTTPVEPEQRASIAGALLDLLSAPHFGRAPVQGRSLRRAMVEYVLRIGYPWALHLEADDLALVRSEVRAVVRTRRRVAVGVGVIVALATAAAVALWPTGLVSRTTTRPRTTDSAALAESQAMATMVGKLRQQGDLVSARVWAEGCALAAREPRPCLLQLRDLASERAALTGFSRDLERLQAIDAQVQRDDVEALRREAASWLETAFLVPVAPAPPGPVLAGAFVERAAEFAIAPPASPRARASASTNRGSSASCAARSSGSSSSSRRPSCRCTTASPSSRPNNPSSPR